MVGVINQYLDSPNTLAAYKANAAATDSSLVPHVVQGGSIIPDHKSLGVESLKHCWERSSNHNSGTAFMDGIQRPVRLSARSLAQEGRWPLNWQIFLYLSALWSGDG
ncbi:hypothetical protein F5883DRAFT_583606 [Diaporthe sp. PMI_573]|nr:hypothetical protein F5883DRAFT_583606 [Diaporthaceae sp. PMI_573]